MSRFDICEFMVWWMFGMSDIDTYIHVLLYVFVVDVLIGLTAVSCRLWLRKKSHRG